MVGKDDASIFYSESEPTIILSRIRVLRSMGLTELSPIKLALVKSALRWPTDTEFASD